MWYLAYPDDLYESFLRVFFMQIMLSRFVQLMGVIH
ncbi:hypothetical protein AAA799B03_01131, partial [Marine Group I thaumarchaeote SCGC AAA799-B03]